MARASRVPLGRMRGDPDVSREGSASHQSGSRRTPLRGRRSSAPLSPMNMNPIIKEYIERLTRGYPGIKSIWLFGSRANNSHRADSDWDLLVFADQHVFEELKRNKNFHDDRIDLLIVFNDNDFEKPWPDDKGAKHGSLKNWDWAETSTQLATYKSVKYKSENEWFKENMLDCRTLKALKIWPCPN